MKTSWLLLVLSGCVIVPAQSSAPAGAAPTATSAEGPADEWTAATDEARRAIDQADASGDPAAYLAARELLVREWANKVAPRAAGPDAVRFQAELATLRDGFPPTVARLMWRTFLGHAAAVEKSGHPIDALVDLPVRGGARSCPRDMVSACAEHVARLARAFPNVVVDQALTPTLTLGKEDELGRGDPALIDLPRDLATWKGGSLAFDLAGGRLEHRGGTALVTFAGTDIMNQASNVCHKALAIRADGVLQIQEHCEPWPAGKPLWSSTATFRLEESPVEIHGGDKVLVVADREKVHAAGGHHPTFTFAAPRVVSVHGKYPGMPPRRGWRALYGVNVEPTLDHAGLGS